MIWIAFRFLDVMSRRVVIAAGDVVPGTILRLEYGGVMRMKAYFPNIIMIDFADPDKCRSIFDLNTAVDQRLAEAYNKYVGA